MAPLLAAAMLALSVVRAAPAELHFDRVGPNQGLDSENITALHQDRAGFLWVGTREGLLLYDGYTFTRFEHDASDPHSISDNSIRTIYEDRGGSLWIGTNTGGLDLVDRATWRFTSFRADASDPRSLSHDSVYAILEDRSGALWVGTQAGLNRFDRTTKNFEHILLDPARGAGFNGNYVTSLLEDRDGALWIGSFGGGLYRRDPASGAFRAYRNDPKDPQSPGSDRLFALAEGPEGDLWIGTDRSVDRMDRTRGTFRHVDMMEAREDGVSSISVDPSGNVWLGTFNKGLVEIDAATSAVRVYRRRPDTDDSLSDDRIMSLALGPPGRLWIGTWGGGLDMLRLGAETFTLLRDLPSVREGLRFGEVTALLTEADGRLFVGTFNAGVMMRAAGTTTFAPLGGHELSEDRAPVFALASTRAGAVWVGSATALLGLDSKGRVIARLRHDPSDPASFGPGYVTSIHEDRLGTLWVGTGGGGLHKLDAAGTLLRRFVHDANNPASLSDDYVCAIAEDRGGTLWVGTRSGGLNMLDPATGAFTRFAPDPRDEHTLGHHYVATIAEDSRGRLWVGTGGGGVDRVDRDASGVTRFTRFTSRDGLIDNNVMSIVEDDDGSLWLGTRRGLARFDPEHGAFASYAVADGLPGSEFNGGAAARGPSSLYLGTTKGVVVIERGTPFPHPAPSPTRITSIRTLDGPIVGSAPVWDLDRIRLDYGTVLFLDFAVLDFRDSRRHRYAYRFDEKGEGWIDLANRRQIIFADLEPGAHTLRVKGRSASGVWSEAPLPLRIDVIPPFWMTAWFRGLVILAAAGAVLSWHSVRTRRLERRNRHLVGLQEELQAAYDRLRGLTRRLEAAKEDERKHIARELHDEMGQALTAAKINMQLLAGLADPEKRAKRIVDTVELVNRMIEHVRALSLDLRPPLLDELGLVPALRGYVEAVAQRSGLEIEVAADPLPPGTPAEIEIVVFRVVQESLTNVLRHAGARSVRIEIRARGEASRPSIAVEIRDDGAGFDVRTALERAAGGAHLGLLGILERVQGLGGEATIDSTPGHGAAVRISVPLRD
jgi:ligand-binding sensor domain-containing protein/signal transduction histidine kinase